jgi:hypothetical protein
MSSEIVYEVKLQPWDRSWLLSGPVGANGKLLFASAREATSFARWGAKRDGGTIKVYDDRGKLFKIIEINPSQESDEGFVLPSA